MSDVNASIEVTLEPLRRAVDLEAGIKRLRAREGAIADAAVAAVIAEVNAFSDTANPRIGPQLERHIAELVAEFLRLLDGKSPQLSSFVADHARDTAEQYFPLESLLQAYRVMMQSLLEAAMEAFMSHAAGDEISVVTSISRFSNAFANLASGCAIEHYLDQSRLLADVASDQRSELFAILLGGYDESDRRVSTLLRDAGYLDKRLRFCVVLAQSIDPTEMHNAARARRLADYIDDLIAPLPGKHLMDIHRNKVTIVLSHPHRLSGWSKPRESLAARIARELMKVGPAARLGVSNDVESTAMVPAAYRQASIAFDASSVGQRVVQFTDIPLQQLLIGFAAEEFARVMPAWAKAFRDADARSRGRLSATVRAYADNDMNLLQTARQLGVHANTVYARFDRIRDLTGRDARGFTALNELLIVAASRA